MLLQTSFRKFKIWACVISGLHRMTLLVSQPSQVRLFAFKKSIQQPDFSWRIQLQGPVTFDYLHVLYILYIYYTYIYILIFDLFIKYLHILRLNIQASYSLYFPTDSIEIPSIPLMAMRSLLFRFNRRSSK